MEATTTHRKGSGYTAKIRHRKGGGYFVTCSDCDLHDFAEHRSTASIIVIEHAKETGTWA